MDHFRSRLDQFWKARLNAQAIRNDCLALALQAKNSVVRPARPPAIRCS
jgi:hypothetical protein